MVAPILPIIQIDGIEFAGRMAGGATGQRAPGAGLGPELNDHPPAGAVAAAQGTGGIPAAASLDQSRAEAGDLAEVIDVRVAHLSPGFG